MMTTGQGDGAPVIEDGSPKIYMDRERLLFTFPGEKPFEIPIHAALHTGSDAERYTNGMLWFMNVQLAELVRAFRDVTTQGGKAADTAMGQLTGLVEVLGKMPGGDAVKSHVSRVLQGKGVPG
jgi:hypothetical protein